MSRSPDNITLDLSVSNIVTNNYRTAEIFKKYNIDFCCGGIMSLKTASEAKDLNAGAVLEELQQFANTYQNAEKWSPDFMMDYLLNIHHNYVKSNIPIVQDYVNRFMSSHSSKYPEIEPLPVLMEELSNKLSEQINFESGMLFPYIKRIIYAYNNNEVYGKHLIRTLHKLSAKDLEPFHSSISEIILEVEEITDNFRIQEKICITHKVMLLKLKEFIDSLHEYVFIEKKYLIPITMQMEKNLLEKYSEK